MRKMERLQDELFQHLTLADLLRGCAGVSTVTTTEKDFNTHNPVTGLPDTVREFDHGAED